MENIFLMAFNKGYAFDFEIFSYIYMEYFGRISSFKYRTKSKKKKKNSCLKLNLNIIKMK